MRRTRLWVLAARLAMLVALSSVSFLGPSSSYSQDRPLPDRDTLFAAARANLERSQREQYRFSYKERRTELHTNPFGKIGTDGSRLYEVVPGPEPGLLYRKLLERDGKAVANSPLEKQQVRPEGSRSKSSLDDIVATLDMQLDRREALNGRSVIVVRFAPRPTAKPQTRQGRLAKMFKGTIWVDEATSEVMRLEGLAIDDLSFGFGVVARLNEGTKVVAIREPTSDELWLPTSVHFSGQGRAMLFRKLNVDYAIEWFDYKRPPGAAN